MEYYFEDDDELVYLKQPEYSRPKRALSQFKGTCEKGFNYNKNKPIVFYKKKNNNYIAWCKYEGRKWIKLWNTLERKMEELVI